MSDVTASGGRFTLWQLITIAASVAVVSAGTGWTVGRTLLADELEQYRKAETWKVPDAISQLTELSGRVSVTLEERASLIAATRLAAELKSENNRLTKDMAERNREAEVLRARLKNLEGDTFLLGVGESRFVLGRELALGVADTNPYSRECDVQFGDRHEAIRPGKTISETRGNAKAVVTLLEVAEDACRFAIAP